MDEKHRQYCIKLGNPYMQESRYENKNSFEPVDSFWNKEEEKRNQDWLKSSNKFTN